MTQDPFIAGFMHEMESSMKKESSSRYKVIKGVQSRIRSTLPRKDRGSVELLRGAKRDEIKALKEPMTPKDRVKARALIRDVQLRFPKGQKKKKLRDAASAAEEIGKPKRTSEISLA